MLTVTRNFLFIMAASFLVGNSSISSVYAEYFPSGIAVSTDKREYRQEETIQIIFTNNSGESVFSHIHSLTPVFCIQYLEKKTANEVWEKLYAQCRFPNCTYETDAPGEIKPGEKKTLEWKPLLFVDGTTKTAVPEPGIYRLVIDYEDYRKDSWKSVVTDTFTIHSGRKK